MPFSLTAAEILSAAGLAMVITWGLHAVARVFRSIVTRSTEFEYAPGDRDSVMERCCYMFPTDHILFNGETFNRGMMVCVVTLKQKTYRARFIGVNRDNMVCFLTDHSIVAQELDMIEDMQPV